ncbi:DUF805 domain-containing protein [Gimesia algae]|uniref:Inner membrane protein YhaI n=1 Tax=Gimesia algae TaxID=2527971 RepID=A0A517VHW4_9PLAN|nr:DUF805 domain-containing protein [Gimesia algae]QDT92609.1 Inner membrane protein YhaI [Gimesia algae]
MNWYLKALKNFATLDGRARRLEYWMFTLFDVIFTILSFVVGAVIGRFLNLADGLEGLGLGMGLCLLYLLVVLMPKLSVTVRRLHDTDRSALWLLVFLIPGIGPLVMFIMMLLEGTAGPNQYGPDPKATAEPAL